MKVYFAGPDIFYPSWESFKASQSCLMSELGGIAVFPVDESGMTAERIASDNRELIRSCDGLCANLAPFRGCEPDSGTVFELAYAYALGKPVASVFDGLAMEDRVRRQFGPCTVHDSGWPLRDRNGAGIEGFGHQLNLMLQTIAPPHQTFRSACENLMAFSAAKPSGL